ncbi:MAG: hypothetical protein B7Z35_11230 [Hydrogenophilales bacterium 12-61-10]|nr:MAG: hypothetical protein B7Z35_11230 [Hydrogenophilales bacterium 12-61-10]
MKKMVNVLLMVVAGLMALPAFAAVNINTATQSELEAVKGLGTTKAQSIIAYREANGSFKSIDDLDKVKGFGKASIEKIRADLSVGGVRLAARSRRHECAGGHGHDYSVPVLGMGPDSAGICHADRCRGTSWSTGLFRGGSDHYYPRFVGAPTGRSGQVACRKLHSTTPRPAAADCPCRARQPSRGHTDHRRQAGGHRRNAPRRATPGGWRCRSR